MIEGKFIRNVVVKAFILFVLFNILLTLPGSLAAIGRFSAYNLLFPGRERFPFGEEPQLAYNLSLYNLEAMFASQRINGTPKTTEEFRVIVLGDSSVWGTLLHPHETLSAQLDKLSFKSQDGRQMRFYNLGYPTMSLAKDVMILDQAMRYEPDLILWLVTLESFPLEKQLESPLLVNNPDHIRRLVEKWQVSIPGSDEITQTKPLWQRTIIAQRRNLADIFRLQLYGVMWAASGIDQVYPQHYEPAQRDFEPDDSFHDFQPGTLDSQALALSLLDVGARIAGDTPLVIINEPILISTGRNSDIRYNFFYPRWAYDYYRLLMNDVSEQAQWAYIDLWDIIPQDEFTNSAVHLTAEGSRQLAQEIGGYLQNVLAP